MNSGYVAGAPVTLRCDCASSGLFGKAKGSAAGGPSETEPPPTRRRDFFMPSGGLVRVMVRVHLYATAAGTWEN